MRARTRTVLASAGLLLAGAGESAAQAWDSPSFLPPRPENTISAYVVQPNYENFGLVGIWRQTGNLNLGVRAGVIDLPDDDLNFLVGAETFGILTGLDRRVPVDVGWSLGLGATFGDGTLLRIPLGAMAGRTVTVGAFAVTPYAHPRVGLDITADRDDTDTGFSFTTDLGADLQFGPSFLVRIGFALFDHDAWGIGIAWLRGRPVGVASP